MAVQKISIQEFQQMADGCLLIDVRSPAEFAHAHIPDAISLPLFSDEERKVVGTAYKQDSREKAIKAGLKYFGPKMGEMVEEVEKIIAHRKTASAHQNNREVSTPDPQKIVVHCWRGGMRSAGVAWLLDLYGFKVYTITGGYKTFRKWVLQQFEKHYDFKVVGGYTGSGKTGLLHQLKQTVATVLDLEGIAGHKGSAFGNMDEVAQPSQEMFENLLAVQLATIGNKHIWVEDESQRIGNLNIPKSLYQNKQLSPVYFIDIPFDERLKYITAGYGQFPKDKLVTAIMRIKKRLGGLETKTAINYLLDDDVTNCFAILLRYYDKCYLKSLHQRDVLTWVLKNIPCQKVDAAANALAVYAAPVV